MFFFVKLCIFSLNKWSKQLHGYSQAVDGNSRGETNYQTEIKPFVSIVTDGRMGAMFLLISVKVDDGAFKINYTTKSF